MYYRINTDGLKLTAFIDKESGPAIFELTGGELYDAEPEELPFKFTVRNPSSAQIPDYVGGKCLMSRRLIEALEKAGVDNLQKFDAELMVVGATQPNRDFYVVNVVGLVAAADMSASESLPLGEGHVFSKLKLDQNAPRGMLMFRLAESLVDVIVHESVVEAIRKGNFFGLDISPVS